MTSVARLAVSWLVRAPGRTLIRVLVLSASVALLGGMLLFVGNSLRTVSASAVHSVPLDLQGPVASYAQARSLATAVAGERGVLQASPVATAPLSGAEHESQSGLTSSGAGAILAIPGDYATNIHTFRFLQGSLQPGAVVLDQQMAATLQAHLGDRILLRVPGLKRPRAFPVSGVALITAADTLFQPLNPLLGPAPAQPPANVAIMPLETFAAALAPGMSTITAVSPGVNSQPGAQSGVQWQVQAQLDPAALSGGSPSSALERATQTRNRIERSLTGRAQFVDNLSESLNTAAGDALYAETLYIMLAIPGALIALGLAYLAALGTVERDRRDLALLRARGARRRDLLALAGFESLILGVIAGLLGTAAAFAAVSSLVSGGAHTSTAGGVAIGAVCIALAGAGAGAARFGASLSSLRTSVASSRRGPRREGKPLWQRLYLDILCLIVSGLIYWLTASTGFSAVVNPDSNPTLSLSVYMFFAPALLWLGATLLLVRARGRALAWVIARAVRGRARTSRALPARQRGAPRRRDQPRADRGRAAARLRREPRHLLRDLRPAGQGRRAAHARRRRDRHDRAGGRRQTQPHAPDRRCPRRRCGHRRGALLRLRRTGPAGHLRHRRALFHGGNDVARLLLPALERAAGARAPAQPPRRDRRQQRDDRRLLLAQRRSAAPARARPEHRQIPCGALPRGRASCRSSPPRRRTLSWSRTSPTSSP